MSTGLARHAFVNPRADGVTACRCGVEMRVVPAASVVGWRREYRVPGERAGLWTSTFIKHEEPKP